MSTNEKSNAPTAPRRSVTIEFTSDQFKQLQMIASGIGIDVGSMVGVAAMSRAVGFFECNSSLDDEISTTLCEVETFMLEGRDPISVATERGPLGPEGWFESRLRHCRCAERCRSGGSLAN